MAAADGEPGADAPAPPPRSGTAAFLVGLGIFLSRVVGLVRERVLATYFGTGLHADVFSAGLRLPNVLQNLLGEGTLSASFIPAYSALLGQGRTEEAGRVAGAAFALLLAVAGAISLLGVLLAPLIVSVFTPGFTGQRRELLIAVVRIVFPMTGVLVLSAWALGILNSHRKFFLPYFAPVLWNAAIIATLVAFGSRLDLDALVVAAAWGALAGGVLQFAVQLPAVWRLDRQIRLGTGRREPAFREAVRKSRARDLGARRRAALGLPRSRARERARRRCRRAAALRADAVLAADQPVRDERRGGRAAGARARARCRRGRAARADGGRRAPRRVLHRAELRRLRAHRRRARRGALSRRRVRRRRRSDRVADPDRLQPRSAGFDGDARLSIGVLCAARHGRRRRASRSCVCS